MIEIPFTKFHGAENDFLITWADAISSQDLAEIARRICARNTGVGADGWIIVSAEDGALNTRLFNSDGSEPEVSGNGTRCAAAFGIIHNASQPADILIRTAAGPKQLRMLSRNGNAFLFEMDMGLPVVEDLRTTLNLGERSFDATILNVGNPQCAIFVDMFPEDWRTAAQEVQCHARFPRRTNVSFVRVLSRHALDVLFFERGAGETRSSGTGSTGAAAAGILRGVADSPVEVKTPAGSLILRWENSIFLTGPAELIAEGRFWVEL